MSHDETGKKLSILKWVSMNWLTPLTQSTSETEVWTGRIQIITSEISMAVEQVNSERLGLTVDDAKLTNIEDVI